MIDVRDLTIGCYVYDGDRTKFPMYVQTIGEDYVYLNFEGNEGDLWESTPDELEGIPITEKMLEEMGFKYSPYETIGARTYTAIYKVNGAREIFISVCVENGSIAVNDKTRISKDVSRCRCHSTIYQFFLHELQNFVFLTTKQQLKVNL